MILYLLYSALSLGLVLAFYHVVLSKEKIYQVNRWYLLTGLIFSLAIPLIPVGLGNTSWITGNISELHVSPFLEEGAGLVGSESKPAENSSAMTDSFEGVSTSSSVGWIYDWVLGLYSFITILLGTRFFLHLGRIRSRVHYNLQTSFKGYRVVLLNREIAPHTFGKTIFVNKQQYEEGAIEKEVLLHEMTHARQFHSLDILLVEMAKTIFWFNPILYVYKSAIQLNHEFIADQNVLSRGIEITDYQAMLLKIRRAKSVPYLNTSLNFKLTQKRFRMMSYSTSTFRASIKAFATIPLFLALAATFGCEPTSMDINNQDELIRLAIVDAQDITLNGDKVSLSEFKSRFSEMPINPKESIIDLKVAPDAPYGVVTEVEQLMREKGTLRINYGMMHAPGKDSEGVQVSHIQQQNIFPILISDEGLLLVNKEPVTIADVDSLVKAFITNEGESENLSTSPQQAIITIKTGKNTPKEILEQVIDRITNAYEEVRNQASMELFNRPFKSLEDGSDQQKKIEEMFPQKISIREPQKS